MSPTSPRNPEEQQRQAKAKLSAHKGKASWGERLVPLADFRRAVAERGVCLDPEERRKAKAAFLARPRDKASVEGPFESIVVFGGVYNNHLALATLLDEARQSRVKAVYCLGDLGGFGPNPEKVWPLLLDGQVQTIQGNYEESLAAGREDCNCGYTDPRDNHFARLSYAYTAAHCSAAFKEWMGELPRRRRVRIASSELLLVHGSPRRVNEFLFSSTSPDPFLETILDQEECDGFLCTHSGLPWRRELPSGRLVVNVGVIGRPANDGQTHVWYCHLESRDGRLQAELRPLHYDFRSLAEEMRREELPEPFIETTLSGWWTTCLEILPAKERSASRF